MQILQLIRDRFRVVLEPMLQDPALLGATLERIVPSREAQLADYQANIAMPLQKAVSYTHLRAHET